MIRLTIPVSLEVCGPLLTKSSAIGRPGVDAVMAAGTFLNSAGQEVKRFYVPGTLIRGLLREAWQELSSIEAGFGKIGEEWLGKASVKDDDPERGRLRFSDFIDWTKDATAENPARTRIQIDEVRGAASGGMLQVMDSPYGAGERVLLAGSIRLLAKTGEPTTDLFDALKVGLRWIRAIGSSKTVGFGSLAGVTIGDPVSSPLPPGKPAAAWRVGLTFQSPVIFSKHRVSDNLFESSESIPGGAIKGAIAEMIRTAPAEFGELSDELHAVRFTHAVPAASLQRPLQWPLSLVCDNHAFEDCVRCKSPISGRAFDVDWKRDDAEAVRKSYRWPEPRHELRVRTAILGETGAASEGQLFAWNMMLPYGLTWRGTVDASRLSETARAQLHSLLAFGIEPLGKSKALSQTKCEEVDHESPAPADSNGYIVNLQTPALLIDPNSLAPDGGLGTSSRGAMNREYQRVWSELSDGSLTLENYFHRCSLAGGEYLVKRFQKSHNRPYLLTDPGSVFWLKPVAGNEAKALEALTGWLRSGLPLSASVRKFYQIDRRPEQDLWMHCPYLPENGYGEITVNQPNPYQEVKCTRA